MFVVKGIVPLPSYFSSEWSFAQFKLPFEGKANVGFGPRPHTILIATYSGSFYKVSFDPDKGGPCVQHFYCGFLNSEKLGSDFID